MNKFAALSLISTASAVTAAPFPSSNFPSYGTIVAPAGANIDSNNNVLAVYFDSTNSKGPYRGFRNDLFVFPTQALGAAPTTDGGTPQALVDQSTTRTFWQTTVALLGTQANVVTYGTVSATTADQVASSNVNTGAVWAVCLNTAALTSIKNCAAVGGNTDKAATDAHRSTWIPNRIVLHRTAVSAQIVVGATSSTGQGVFTYDNDILLASLYHSSGDVATPSGAIWCSAYQNELDPASTTPKTISAVQGFKGYSKCTWALYSKDATAAPSFKITEAAFSNFILGWIEWAVDSELTGGSFMPAASVTPFFLGAYATASGPFLNPAKVVSGDVGSSWVPATTVFDDSDRVKQGNMNGSIGIFKGYNGAAGTDQAFADVSTTYDSAWMIRSINAKKAEFSDYNNALNSYNTLRTAYNSAIDTEKKRLADFFAAAFTPATSIPQRPCPPTQPRAYSGPYIDKSVTAFPATNVNAANFAVVPNVAGQPRKGYYASSTDTATLTADSLKYSGKVFGRLGQGKGNMPGVAPFYWNFGVAAGKPTIIVSLFPEAEGDSGLDASTKFVKIEATAAKFEDLATYAAPAQPAAAENPVAALGAQFLAATFISAAAVIATL